VDKVQRRLQSDYEVGSVSRSGKTFGVVVEKAAAGGNTFYVDGAVRDW
jgi:hypothetical protein